VQVAAAAARLGEHVRGYPAPVTTPAQHHAAAASTLAARIAGTTDWDVPTPVKEWRARDVVQHLIDWFPGFIANGSDERLDDVDGADPGKAWQSRAAAVQAILDDPARAGSPYKSRMFGTLRLEDAIDRFYTPDIVMHTWDLARATGQDDTMPRDEVRGMFAGMSQMADSIRSSGQFGDQQPVDDDAPLQDRFIAFIGRDPGWRPAA